MSMIIEKPSINLMQTAVVAGLKRCFLKRSCTRAGAIWGAIATCRVVEAKA